MPKSKEKREAETVTAKVDPPLMDALDAYRAQKKREGLKVARSQALVAFAMRGAGLAEEPAS